MAWTSWSPGACYVLEPLPPPFPPQLPQFPLFQTEVRVRKQKGIQRRNFWRYKRELWLRAGGHSPVNQRGRRAFLDQASHGQLASVAWGPRGVPAPSQPAPSLAVPPFAAGALDPAASRQVCLLTWSSCSLANFTVTFIQPEQLVRRTCLWRFAGCIGTL